MEIKINIPKNDYVQPTEVRENVVQMVCDSLLQHRLDDEDIVFPCEKPQAQLLVCGYNTPYLRCGRECKKRDDEDINVRTCEMQAAFDALQDAGYYIYGFKCLTGETNYYISSKPSYGGNKAERINFDVFID